jgi:eukaryotic-like serine/threonine-protein kinase
MTLIAGSRLGPYEIVSPLGAGGMGEVYKAKDTRLDRLVAVKVLPEHLAGNPELRQRFEREARAISQLTHPNICALYDVGNADGVEYLVMELLEGQTLADRVEKGPLPTAQVLKFGIEIADALDKAHRAGIIHRDLKPGNVMVTRSGVKLLDFGLAKLRAANVERDISQLSSLPTELSPSQPLTEQGTVMGTFQYMAPEQLEGKEADSRTDIFSFGCVLYEMATGKKAFTGKSRASMIAAILEHEPAPISSIEPMTPPALDRVVKTCLAKDPDDRWQSAHDVKSELAWIAEAGSQAGAPATVVSRRKNRERIAWLVAAAGFLIATFALVAVLRRPEIRSRAVRLSFDKPAGASLLGFDSLTPSPDGSRVALVTYSSAAKSALAIRSLDSLEMKTIPGTEDARFPFWSPDGRTLAFFADGKLKKVDAEGGPVENLCNSPGQFGGAWGSKGTIIFAPHEYDGLYKISAAGGTPAKVTALAPGDEAHRWPSFLPDGDHFVFLIDAQNTEGHWIALSSLGSGKVERLIHAISDVAYVSPGYLVYVKSGSLVAHPFDPSRLRFSGNPTPVATDLAENASNHHFDFGASENGVLLYQTADPNLRFRWFDRSGKALGDVGDPGRYGLLDLSPDGTTAVFEMLDNDRRHSNIGKLDLLHGSTSRITTTASSDYNPVWMPDGRRVVFGSARSGGVPDLYDTSVSIVGEDRLLFKNADGAQPWSVSPDGRTALVMSVSAATKGDLWLLPLGNKPSAAPFRRSAFDEEEAQFSPDGKWVAFSSDDTGRQEVYVRSLSDTSEQIQVSSGGGRRPRWRNDGRELFFASLQKLMAVSIQTSPSFRAGEPAVLFSLEGWNDYAVAKDGQRFLIEAPASEASKPSSVAVLNWTSAIKD